MNIRSITRSCGGAGASPHRPRPPTIRLPPSSIPPAPLTVTGVVQKLEWTNPHARLYVDAKDDKGNVVHWDFELGPPNGLMRRGWNRNSLKQGHVVTIEGFHSKTQPNIANARSVKLPDGRNVFAGSSFDVGDAPGQ